MKGDNSNSNKDYKMFFLVQFDYYPNQCHDFHSVHCCDYDCMHDAHTMYDAQPAHIRIYALYSCIALVFWNLNWKFRYWISKIFLRMKLVFHLFVHSDHKCTSNFIKYFFSHLFPFFVQTQCRIIIINNFWISILMICGDYFPGIRYAFEKVHRAKGKWKWKMKKNKTIMHWSHDQHRQTALTKKKKRSTDVNPTSSSRSILLYVYNEEKILLFFFSQALVSRIRKNIIVASSQFHCWL